MPNGPPDRQPLLQQAAIAIGAAILLFCLASVFRWEIVPSTPVVGVMRLDRWTGAVVFCAAPLGSGHNTLDCTTR